jgi:hypothetical protein
METKVKRARNSRYLWVADCVLLVLIAVPNLRKGRKGQGDWKLWRLSARHNASSYRTSRYENEKARLVTRSRISVAYQPGGCGISQELGCHLCQLVPAVDRLREDIVAQGLA